MDEEAPYLGLPVQAFASQDAWRSWLEEHHAGSRGLWVKLAKKASGIPSVTQAQAVEVALCYGWIDGVAHPLDADWWLQRFTPRGPRSKWSKINCARVATLIEAGLMRPAGLREIERAKADGRWDRAYDPQSTASVPPDLAAALDANLEAKAFFATLRGADRYAILYRVQDAKRPATRAQRIETYVAMLARGETLRSLTAPRKPNP